MKILDVPQSGSLAGITSSRNRFGQYRRTRAIPVNPNSTWQGTMRARFGENSEAWRALTAEQRAGWESLGLLITRTDSLGQSYTLTGLQTFVMVNNNLMDAGEAAISAAPALAVPAGLITAVITLTAAALSVAYTTTPLPALTRLFSYASPQRSAGREYESDYRLIAVSAVAAASPANIYAGYCARFGVPVVGNKVFFSFSTHKGGFLSAALRTSAIVTV